MLLSIFLILTILLLAIGCWLAGVICVLMGPIEFISKLESKPKQDQHSFPISGYKKKKHKKKKNDNDNYDAGAAYWY